MAAGGGPPQNSRLVSGWTSVRVTRGIERMTSDFEIALTERFPTAAADYIATPGDACTVFLGADAVITGYVDHISMEADASHHTVRISGRGKCCDFVDCSAEWVGNQISGASSLEIANQLAAPYGIKASLTDDPANPHDGVIPQFNFGYGETPFDILERICRYRALLLYEGTDGNLVLSIVGTARQAGGLVQGVNVQSAAVTLTMDQRFSQYFCYLLSMDTAQDIGDAGNLVAQSLDGFVPRHRRRDIICESGSVGLNLAQPRADWENARRYGRSRQIRVTTDSWRDSAGALWTPNTLVSATLPAWKVAQSDWLISEVTFKQDEGSGTTADLLLMPPDAFAPEPIVFQPAFNDVPPAPGK